MVVYVVEWSEALDGSIQPGLEHAIAFIGSTRESAESYAARVNTDVIGIRYVVRAYACDQAVVEEDE